MARSPLKPGLISGGWQSSWQEHARPMSECARPLARPAPVPREALRRGAPAPASARTRARVALPLRATPAGGARAGSWRHL